MGVTWVDLVEGVGVQAGARELQDDGQGATGELSARLSVFFQSGEHQREELLLQTQQLHTGSGLNGRFSTIQSVIKPEGVVRFVLERIRSDILYDE